MTITRAEFEQKGVRYAAVFEAMMAEGGGRRRPQSKTRFHFAIREIVKPDEDGFSERAVLTGDYEVGVGCRDVGLFPGLKVDVIALLYKAMCLFGGSKATRKYEGLQCCRGKGELCATCEGVRAALDRIAAQRVEPDQQGSWRKVEKRARRLHCHHKGRRSATG